MLSKTRLYTTIVFGGLLLCATPAFGEVIDKIVIVINDRFIITLSDIQKERALQLALGTSDLGNDEDVAKSLEEKYLVEEQMAQFTPIEITEERIEERLREIKDSRGFSQQELRQAVLSKLKRSDFMIQRFGPTVRVSDEELRAYYNDVYVPTLRRQGSQVPGFEQSIDTVRQMVIVLKIGDELDLWMNDLLRRTKVEKVSK